VKIIRSNSTPQKRHQHLPMGFTPPTSVFRQLNGLAANGNSWQARTVTPTASL